MNREIILKIIRHQLALLASETEIASGGNMQDINLISEDFYRDLLNVIFDWTLVNANGLSANFPGVDLLDKGKKILVQVSSTCRKEKIKHSIDEIEKKGNEFDGYRFIFLSLVKDATALRNKNYSIPSNISFNPEEDIDDVSSIFQKINGLSIAKIEAICKLCKSNICFEPNVVKLESSVTKIINILSSRKLSKEDFDIDTIVYDINEKIIANDIGLFKDIINEYKAYYNCVKRVYEEFDKNGNNKSIAILHSLHKMYLESSKQYHGDDIYKCISEQVKKVVVVDLKGSDTYLNIEDLDFYIDIILIHAFIECQIYKKP